MVANFPYDLLLPLHLRRSGIAFDPDGPALGTLAQIFRGARVLPGGRDRFSSRNAGASEAFMQ
jgi:hypothetical protein